MRIIPSLFLLVAAAAAGCALTTEDPVTTPGDVAALRVGGAIRLQAGSKLIVYGVTDDDYAIYQDGPTIYATPLAPNGRRRVVASVGATQPLVMVRGRIAFVWTTQFYFGAGGNSPLIVWTSAAGPKVATDASVASFIATRGVAVRPDGREILFIANVDAAGAIGDIVSASPDLSSRRTLVAGIDVNFNGACPPLVGFDRKASPLDVDTDHVTTAHPVAAYCPGGATIATLSRWVDGTRTDLSTAVALRPTWSADDRGNRFFTIEAPGGTPVSISASGTRTVLDAAPATQGFLDVDGAAVTAAGGPNGVELHRITGNPPHADVLADLASGFIFNQHFDEGFRQYTDTPFSSDGKLMLYATGSDPNTGLFDINLVDVSRPAPATMPLQPIGRALPAFELFTADASHALYYQMDPVTFNPTLFAASMAGDNRPVSDGTPTEFVHFAVEGTKVVYSDHMNGTGVGMFDLHDLMLADVGSDEIAPTLLAGQIYNLFFMSHDRRWALYTSDSDPKSTGLFAVRTR